MAFARTLQVHLLVNGSWVDVTATDEVRQADPIAITLGGMDEQRHPVPSRCTFMLDNRARKFSRRNPSSAYYKQLGTNTPVTVRMLLAEETFSGTTVDGWGSADAVGIRDTAYSWSLVGTAADFDEAAGAGTIVLSAAATNHYGYLPDVSYRNVGVLVECTVAVNNVTGGAIEPANILLRGVGTNPSETYYMIRVSISAAEVLTVALMTAAGATIVSPVTVSGVVDAVSSKTISVRAEIEGEIIRCRVWKTGDPEPGTWAFSTEDRTYLTAGWVGVRAGLAAGNTNTPVTFSHNVIQVYSMEFAGEVAKWPPSRDRSGNDRFVKVEAWDLFQRLRQGESRQDSALRRGITGMTTPAVAYWPCEDGRNATSVASASPAAPMWYGGTSPDFATNDDFDCSDALPVLSQSALFGTVPTYTPTSGQSQIRFLLSVPSGGDTNGEKILRASMTGGTTGFWDVLYGTGGTMTLNIYDPAGALLATTGAVAFTLNGRPVRFSLELTQSGADINWALSVLDLTGTGGGTSGTLAGRTYGRVDWVNLGGDALFTGTAVGHITVQGQVDAIGSLLSELMAYAGEVAEARIRKLAQASGITVYVGQGSTSGQTLGAQRPLKLLDLFEECVVGDLGGMGSPRGEVGIVYKRLNYFYNQTAAVTLDHSNHELQEFTPNDDNFLTRNTITVRRTNGSEYSVTKTTGPLAAVDPIDGGIGVYDEAPEVNLSTDLLLPDAAGYRLLQGTIDQPRFPEVELDLANLHLRAKETTTRQLIDLGLWERMQVTNPSAEDLYDTVDLLTVGMTKVLSKFVHRLTINANPYDPYRVLELDNDTYDRLDIDGCTLAEDLDTTETGVDVSNATPNDAYWGTDTPYDIAVGGERMTVTAVSGTGASQTLTVTRSVNGVVKTHSIGDEVHLADPVYLPGW